jgi:hypothetical protein
MNPLGTKARKNLATNSIASDRQAFGRYGMAE